MHGVGSTRQDTRLDYANRIDPLTAFCELARSLADDW